MTNSSDAANKGPDKKVYGPQPMSEDAQMARYDIVCEPASIYCYGGYRYTSLKDALAQAKRDEKAV